MPTLIQFDRADQTILVWSFNLSQDGDAFAALDAVIRHLRTLTPPINVFTGPNVSFRFRKP